MHRSIQQATKQARLQHPDRDQPRDQIRPTCPPSPSPSPSPTAVSDALVLAAKTPTRRMRRSVLGRGIVIASYVLEPGRSFVVAGGSARGMS